MTVKLPVDPSRPPEMQRFLDDLTKIETRLQTIIDAEIAALPAFASVAEAEALTSTTVMMNPARTKTSMVEFASQVLHVQEQQSSGTAGGTFTQSAWQTRTLNTAVINGITGASLASNEITLPAGFYEIIASAPAYTVGVHKARLYNVTGAATLLLGTDEAMNASQTRSHISGFFTLASSSAVRIEHYCSTTKNTNGFGVGAAFGVTVVFTDVLIRKLD